MSGFKIIFFVYSHFFLSYHEKATELYTSLLRSCRLSVYHTWMSESRLVSFPTAQQANLPACFTPFLLC